MPKNTDLPNENSNEHHDKPKPIQGILLATVFIAALFVITRLLHHPVSIATWVFCWLILFLYFGFKSKLKALLKRILLP